jgi:hypothetical protein
MTYGTSANTYLVGRRPSRSSPHRRSRNRPARQGPAIQHMGRGPIALTAHCAHFYLTHRPLQTSRTRPLRLRSPKTSHPRRQDAQINYLDILAIFVKQTTYLAILLLFGHLALIWSPCPIAPPRQRNSKKTKRNLFCATSFRSRGT